jgi:hypothetical protein
MIGCFQLQARVRLSNEGLRRKGHTGKRLCFISWYRPQVLQIALVSYEHDDDVGIGMIPELL